LLLNLFRAFRTQSLAILELVQKELLLKNQSMRGEAHQRHIADYLQISLYFLSQRQIKLDFLLHGLFDLLLVNGESVAVTGLGRGKY